MNLSRLLLAAVMSATLVACADQPADPNRPGVSGEPQRYEADATVLESPDHGPQLCFGVEESYPPQCSGLPLVNWDWGSVEGEESARGTTWGDFHVEGTYDGTTFTVLETGPYEPSAPDPLDFTPPCPEPEGGWVATEPGLATEEARIAAATAAQREPDFAGIWIDYVSEPSESTPPEEIILVATFTGDLERHEAELREIWGGPLCVARHERTYDELLRIQAELTGEVGVELGLQVISSGGDVVDNLVEVGVVVSDEDDQIAVEERYGAGAVRLVPALTPVPVP